MLDTNMNTRLTTSRRALQDALPFLASSCPKLLVLQGTLSLSPKEPLMFPGILEKSFAKCPTPTWAGSALGAALGSVVLKLGGMWCLYLNCPGNHLTKTDPSSASGS